MKHRDLDMNVDYGWEQTDYSFPNTFPGHNYPAIYTWVLVSKSGDKSYYLGETSNLSRRVSYYMRPRSDRTTNHRMKAEMDKSREVKLYVLKIESFVLNAVEIDEKALEDPRRDARRVPPLCPRTSQVGPQAAL